jgi:hypothetical protein
MSLGPAVMGGDAAPSTFMDGGVPLPGLIPLVRRVVVILLVAQAALAAVRPSSADALPLLSIDDAHAKEGDSGTRTITFKVRLNPPVAATVDVQYSTEDGTATVADDDYDPASGTIEFAPGADVQTIYVTLHGDTKIEGNEYFRVRLGAPVNAAIGDGEAIATIVNDDGTVFVPVNTHANPYFSGTLPNAWGDYDGDGVPDLPLYHLQPVGVLNEIPGFRDLLDNGNYHGIAWCDFDRDGDLDLVLLGYSGVEGGTPTASRLLRNDGGDAFVDVAPLSGIDVIGSGETPVWADVDGDGWPDLFTPYYSHIFPFQSFLYHNNRDGTFTDIAAQAGVSLPELPVGLRPEGAQAADWNDDGHIDLYCASHLFLNDGTGHFTDVRADVGLPVLFDEGAALVDIDSDGDLDLFLRALDGPRLFRNDAGHFTEVTAQAGLTPLPLLWGDSWADVDGDGDLDLLLQSGDTSTILMLNQGDGTFERDTTWDELHAHADLSAWADIDQDGDVDLVLGAGAARNLYRNRLETRPGFAGSHLAVRVLDAEGHQTMYGATVRLREIGGPPGTTQTRVVDGGSGYLSQNEYDVHFGGLGRGRYALEVVCPSPAGQRVVIDSLSNPLLGSLEPATMAEDHVTVRTNGSVQLWGAQAVAGVAPGSSEAVGLGSPYPMPARVAMTIPVAAHGPGNIALTILDLGGRRVRRLDLPAAGGARWDLRDERRLRVPAGLYFCRLTVDGREAGTRRLVVLP